MYHINKGLKLYYHIKRFIKKFDKSLKRDKKFSKIKVKGTSLI